LYGVQSGVEPKVAPGHYALKATSSQHGYTGDVGMYIDGHLQVVVDVSVAGVETLDPLGVTRAVGSIRRARACGYAAGERERTKVAHYVNGTTLPVTQLRVFALETLGAWGQQAVNFMRTITIEATLTKSVKDEAYATKLRNRVQTISFILQKGNAFAIENFARQLRWEGGSLAEAEEAPG
jgi:hypothetical protein